METARWKKISMITGVCLLIAAVIWGGMLLNAPKETMIMNTTDDWTGAETATPPVDVTPPDKMETATFALG
jgi:hypothetical protein